MKSAAVLLGVVVFLLPGCGHHHDWLIREPGVESTIAKDPNKEPVGRAMAPAGMGVDL